VTDAFVRPSVATRTLSYDVWVTNASSRSRKVRLLSHLRSWNRRAWRYPRLPTSSFTLPAGATKKVTVGPVAWKLGRESWWWPNLPYRAGYRAQLHDLVLRVADRRSRAARTSRRSLHRAIYRFGFREFRQVGTTYQLNGVRVNLRGDSLQGAQYDRIDYGGKGDAYDTFPGFLPPSPRSPGWPKAVDNFQRLNFSVLRIHQEPPSPYMLDVADEMGLMIIGESAIRGSESRQNYTEGRPNFVAHVRDLVRRDRNHAAIVRWSQSNEPDISATDSVGFERELYRTVMANDGTRPVSIDVSSDPYNELAYPNFSTFQHYVQEDGTIATGYTDDVHPRTDRPFGRGEFIWPRNSTKQGFTWFATATEKMREKDAADIRPYSLAGAWASSIPGVRSGDFLTDANLPPLYGEDNLPDPWSHRQIRRLQAGFNPVLVADRDYWERQKESDSEGNWPSPSRPVTLPAGRTVTRSLVVFNDTLDGRRVDVAWEARRGSPDGAVAAAGRLVLDVPLGSRVVRDISFTTPPAPGERLYLVLAASKPGFGELFREREQFFTLAP